MAALTRMQLDHATLRLEEQTAAFIRHKLDELGEQPKLIEHSGSEKTAMLHDGRATVKADYSADRRTYGMEFGDGFDYPMTPEMEAARRAHEAWEAEAEAIRAKAHRIKQSVLDELIMSPDGKAALDRIAQAFQ